MRMLGQNASDGIFARYDAKTKEKGSHRADLHFADFRVLGGGTAAEILVSYREETGEPDRNDIKRFIKAKIGSNVRIFESSMQTHPGLSHRNERGGVAVVIGEGKEFLPFNKSHEMREMVANALFMDREGATWDVDASEGNARRLVRSESEDLMDILEQRQAEIGGHDRSGVTFAKAFAISKSAGRATLSVGDTVRFYYDGSVYSNGVIESLQAGEVRVSHPKFEEPITCDLSNILQVTTESPEGEMSKRQSRDDYFSKAYGYNPEDTRRLTDMKTADSKVVLGDTMSEIKSTKRNIRKTKARIAEYGNRPSWRAEKKADKRVLSGLRSNLAALQTRAAAIRTGSARIVADHFSEGDQIQLIEEYTIGMKGLANDFDRTSKIEPTETVIPAGTTGMIERVVNFGSPNETYVVKFSDGCMCNMPSHEAGRLMKSLSEKNAGYEENVTVAGVNDVRHARIIARNYFEQSIGHTPVMANMEVYCGHHNSKRATMVNAHVEDFGWRKLAITATRVEDVSNSKIGGAKGYLRRSAVDPNCE